MVAGVNPVVHIRTAVFGCKTQDAFAELLGTTQPTVSRWETWGRIPGHRQGLVREAARKRGISWDDRWFFAVAPKRRTRAA